MFLFRFASVVVFLLPSISFATDPVWTTHGPDGGSVTAVAVDPANADVVYAGSFNAGLFKSVDGGGHWASVNGGLPFGNVTAVAVDPVDPATVYSAVSSSVFKSVDGGGQWTALALPSAVPGIGYPQTLAVENSHTLLVSTCNALFESADGGAAWTTHPIQIGGGILCPTHLTLDPADSKRIYASTAEGLLRSADGGATWTLPLRAQLLLAAGSLLQTCDQWGYYVAQATGTPAPKPEQFNSCANRDAPVHLDGYLSGLRYYIAQQPNPAMYGLLAGPEAIALDPRAAGTLYASTYWGIFKSTDFGASWSPIASGLPKPGVIPPSLTIDADGALYVSVSAPAATAVYRSSDGGASWSATAHFDFQPPNLLFADPRRPGVVYGSNPLALYKTVDRGATWSAVNRGLATSNVGSVTLDPDDPNRVFAIVFPPAPGAGAGLVESTDGGVTWPDAGLPVNNPTSVAAAPGGIVYAGACCASSGTSTQSVLFRSADRGVTWVNAGLPPKDGIGRLIVDAQDPFTIYTQTRSGIAASTDGGAHWQEGLGADIFKPGISVLVPDPARPGALYASRYNADAKDGAIYHSADFGATWDPVPTAWPNDLYNVVALVMDARNPSTLYAAVQELDCDFYDCPNDYFERLQGAPAQGLWKTTDGGRTWSRLNFPTRVPPYRLTGDSRDSSTIYAVADYPNRVFRSTDGAATWTDISPGPLTVLVSSLAVAGGEIYAGTYGGGVFEISLPRAQ